MEIDKENGCFIGPDGCHYETEWEARHIGVLGMCGCGWPETTYNFLREVIKQFDRRDKSKEWVNAESKVVEMVKANPEIAAHALIHFISDKEVIEHGSGVGGSWLTKSGEEIVDGEPAPPYEEAA